MAQVICEKCRNDRWDIREWENRAYCTNCNEPRLYRRRNYRNGLTKSQKARISAIKDFFLSRSRKELARFDVQEHDFGTCYVMAETATMSGGMFQIGRRGKVKCLIVYDLTDDKERIARHYEAMLRK